MFEGRKQIKEFYHSKKSINSFEKSKRTKNKHDKSLFRNLELKKEVKKSMI